MKLQYALAAACMAAAGMMGVADVRAAYPERPVTMIVVFPPGGSTDLIGRAMQPAFGRALGVDVVVKNAGGGGGTIGTAEIAAARPDGYTQRV
jgi:tripartite-type tricarboxylate transporter receptor subunit TctC